MRWLVREGWIRSLIVVVEDQSRAGIRESRHGTGSRLRVREFQILEVAAYGSVADETIRRVIGGDDEIGKKDHHAVASVRVNAATGL